MTATAKPFRRAPNHPGTRARPYEGVPFIAYVRVSTWREDKVSPELQQAAIEAWAERSGARIVDWVEDLDATGRNFKRKITRCVERVEAGEARGVAVWRYSRFGRNRTGNAVWLARLENAGGHLESATEQVDATTAVGRFQRGMILEFGNYESDRAGEQWKEAHDYRRYTLHLPATGRPRFGYIWHRRRLPDPASPTGIRLQTERYELDDGPAHAIADAYRAYVGGTKFYTIAQQLNAGGWRTTTGAYWYEQAVLRYMDSGFPAGLLRVHDPECKCGADGPAKSTCPRHLFIVGAHDEAIDADLWQAYLTRREEVKGTPPRARAATYALTGLAKHEACRKGANAIPGYVQGEYVRGHAYQCDRRRGTARHGCPAPLWVRRDRVEDDVLAWLRREVAPGVDALPQTVPDHRPAVEDPRAVAARDRIRHQAEIDKQRKALATLRADRAANPEEYGPGEYEAAAEIIRDRLTAAEQALEQCAAVEDTPDRAAYEPVMLDLLDAWPHLSGPEANRLLRRVLRRVALVSGPGGPVRVEMHPVWEPDPWADQPAE